MLARHLNYGRPESEDSLELRHLRYFTTVAELGSVSRAAEKLFVAQPALSLQIRQLEEEIGARLLERLPRGVRLTPAGESFLEDARAILARAQQAAVRARERQSGLQATFRMALVPIATHTVLPGLLQAVRAAAIPATLEVREMINSRQVMALRNNEIDLGLTRPGDEQTALETVAAIDDPYCLAVPVGSSLASGKGTLPLKLAADEPFVGFSRHREADYFDRTTALCTDAGFSPGIRHEATQFINVLTLVGHGLGVAIVPASASVLPFGNVVFRRLKKSAIKSRLVLLRSPRAARDAQAARIVGLAVAELEALGRRLAAARD